MTRAMVALCGVATAALAAPAAAQWLGEPVWNSPTGGGLAISVDYAKPNTNYGHGSTVGARVSWGRGIITLTAGAANWKPEGASESLTSIGGTTAIRLIGGTLPPIASQTVRANLQLGVAHTELANFLVSATSGTAITGAVGVGVRLPASRVSVEPYVSPGIRYRHVSGGGSRTRFGYTIGANIGFGLLGVHAAYDNENVAGSGSVSVFGVGAYVTP